MTMRPVGYVLVGDVIELNGIRWKVDAVARLATLPFVTFQLRLAKVSQPADSPLFPVTLDRDFRAGDLLELA